VFVREDGLPYFPEHFSTAWERHIARLGLRPIRLHDARHTAATLGLTGGEKIEVVSKWRVIRMWRSPSRSTPMCSRRCWKTQVSG
jgi:integrase